MCDFDFCRADHSLWWALYYASRLLPLTSLLIPKIIGPAVLTHCAVDGNDNALLPNVVCNISVFIIPGFKEEGVIPVQGTLTDPPSPICCNSMEQLQGILIFPKWM